ncbi:hypothetical protein Dimus_008170 [Dionaea muscipula]
MQRWCTKLRYLSLQSITRPPPLRPLTMRPPPLSLPPLFCCRLHSSSSSSLTSHRQWSTSSNLMPSFNPFIRAALRGYNPCRSSQFPHHYLHSRNFSAKSKEKKWKKLTPATSKVKKTKMKAYSSFKDRFRTMHDGNIRRWKAGKRHNAHSKSKKAKRRLRRPGIVSLAYAKVLKKLDFCG